MPERPYSRPDYARWDVLHELPTTTAAYLLLDIEPHPPEGPSPPPAVSALAIQLRRECPPDRVTRFYHHHSRVSLVAYARRHGIQAPAFFPELWGLSTGAEESAPGPETAVGARAPTQGQGRQARREALRAFLDDI
jgi:hypothetical protein